MTNTIECSTQCHSTPAEGDNPSISARALVVNGHPLRVEFNAEKLSTTDMFQTWGYLRQLYGDKPEIIGIINGFTTKDFTADEVQEVLSRRHHM